MKLLTPFVYVAISVALFFLIINPEYGNTKELMTQIEENNKMLVLATELRDKQTELQQKNVAISQEERTRLEKLLPEAVDNVGLVLDVSNISGSTIIRNIGIDSDTKSSETTNTKSNIKTVSGNSNYGAIDLNFSFVSNYEYIKSFLKKLEDSLRLVDIVGIDIVSANNREAAELYNVTIKLKTYWLR